ncbi:hypothetical protein SAMN04488498_10397 [Mesorhizobium albiziae]|uniref:Phage holin family protein n=1 Tax=Neomesorhizobium albiziae TaxID=335020 RepID=A0A1I3XC27_9HYPH|nr:hypothetical protein [Mesorhizobium albiziae]GLS30586.1 hypothetical protein GCM10007937_22940 [Mesorhizobium albiziae]SFK16576.1 hypothetical protein SAMN04488498_10397 [Mesorhizobium albiziae]
MLASLLAAFASGETFQVARRLRRAAIAYFLAGLAGLTALGFLVGAGYVAAARAYGSVEAALGFAAGFFLLAIIILIIHRIVAGMRARSIARKRSGELATIATAAAIAVLPTLLRGKGGLTTLLAPVLAVAAYAIFRENSKKGPDPDEPV